MNNQANSRIVIFSIVCALYCAVCFLFKYIAKWLIATGNKTFNPIFEFYYTKNTGAAFSFMEGKTVLLCGITLVIVFVLLGCFVRNINKLSLIELNGFCFLLAGIFSNFMERVLDGFVTDYFRLIFVSFPIFNLADVFINIGAVLLIASLIETKRSANG